MKMWVFSTGKLATVKRFKSWRVERQPFVRANQGISGGWTRSEWRSGWRNLPITSLYLFTSLFGRNRNTQISWFYVRIFQDLVHICSNENVKTKVGLLKLLFITFYFNYLN